MTWTEPEMWEVGDVLTKDRLNQEIRDNLSVLKNPPTASFSPTSNYATTSTSFVDVNSTDMSLDITPGGSEVCLFISATLAHTVANAHYALDVTMDSVSLTGLANGIGAQQGPNSASSPHIFQRMIYVSGLTPGALVNFKLQWRVIAGGSLAMLNTTTLCQFIAREVS